MWWLLACMDKLLATLKFKIVAKKKVIKSILKIKKNVIWYIWHQANALNLVMVLVWVWDLPK